MPPKNAIHKLSKSVPDTLPGNLESTLRGAIDSSGEGFALFGPDDRLIFCNPAYLRIHPLKDFIKPGVRFEDIIRENIKRGNIAVAAENEEAFLKNRLKQHRNPKGPIYRRMSNGSSFIINETRTPEGGILMTATKVSELREIEEELKKGEERLRNAVSSLQEGFALYDSDDRLVLFNDEYLRLHAGMEDVIKPGMLFEDMIRIHVERGLNADATGNKDKYLRNRMERHRNPKGPITRTLTNGTSYLIIESPTSHGGVVVTEVDITEQKKTEAALKDSEALLNDALESITGGVALFDKFDRFVLCNSTYREKLKEVAHALVPGCPYKELLQAYADKGLNTDALEDPEKYIRERLERHKNLEPTTVQITKTGEWIMLREYRTSDGGTLIVRTDITDRIKAEQALRDSEERLKDITDAALDYFWEIGADLRFTFVSERFFQNSRISPGQIIGKTRHEFAGPEIVRENPELWKALQNDLDNRRPFRNFEYSRPFDDAKRLYFSVSGKPFFDKDGKFLGYRGASTDTTERRRTERELTHHKKMESLGYLAGGMAHNLNNMLLPILILGQMTRDNLPEESLDRQNLEIICRAAANAKELVGRISGFSRQQGMDMKSADIHEVIRDGLALIASIVPSRITLKQNLDKNTGTVFLDPAQTQTVLINLVANAVDAMEGGKGELSVSLSKTLIKNSGENSIPGLPGGAYAKLTITDTGHGMDDETLNKIFDPFFTTKGAAKGTGLGLSTAFGTIHKHGGTIRAASTLGKGTTFDIFLPLQKKS